VVRNIVLPLWIVQRFQTFLILQMFLILQRIFESFVIFVIHFSEIIEDIEINGQKLRLLKGEQRIM
jgi:hypothetical protein